MKELEPKTTEWFGGILVELFGPAGVKVAQLERREEEGRRNERLSYFDALREVQ